MEGRRGRGKIGDVAESEHRALARLQTPFLKLNLGQRILFRAHNTSRNRGHPLRQPRQESIAVDAGVGHHHRVEARRQPLQVGGVARLDLGPGCLVEAPEDLGALRRIDEDRGDHVREHVLPAAVAQDHQVGAFEEALQVPSQLGPGTGELRHRVGGEAFPRPEAVDVDDVAAVAVAGGEAAVLGQESRVTLASRPPDRHFHKRIEVRGEDRGAEGVRTGGD